MLQWKISTHTYRERGTNERTHTHSGIWRHEKLFLGRDNPTIVIVCWNRQQHRCFSDRHVVAMQRVHHRSIIVRLVVVTPRQPIDRVAMVMRPTRRSTENRAHVRHEAGHHSRLIVDFDLVLLVANRRAWVEQQRRRDDHDDRPGIDEGRLLAGTFEIFLNRLPGTGEQILDIAADSIVIVLAQLLIDTAIKKTKNENKSDIENGGKYRQYFNKSVYFE